MPVDIVDGITPDTTAALAELRKRDPEKLRRAIVLTLEVSGGLATAPDLARRYHLSTQRMYELVARKEFPEPVAIVSGGRTRLYLVAQVDVWQRERARRLGEEHRAR